MKIGKWIEAMRLRTLPVSVAGVIAGIGCSVWQGRSLSESLGRSLSESFSWGPALICIVFALLAQIASNFGNEYYDFKNGLDRKGRDGFRRGVTEGDISPVQMRNATFITLGAACVVGSLTLFYGGLWLLPIGILIVLAAIAYSAGPYPLSHHGLGDVAVILFFGIVPVNLTCYLQIGDWSGIGTSLPVSAAVGLLAANVLIVNNYRDFEDDRSVGKRTTVVIFGRKTMGWVYLISGIVAMIIMLPVWINLICSGDSVNFWGFCVPLAYLVLHVATWNKVVNSEGAALNPLLGKTAKNLMLFSLLLFAAFVLP